MKNLSLIACVNLENVIGLKSKPYDLPYRISSDLKRFKELTTGHRIVMGMNTFCSMKFKFPLGLPKRQNVVVTRKTKETYPLNSDEETQLCFIGQNTQFPQCLELFKDEPEVFIIGGGEIYDQTIKMASKLYLTIVYDKLSEKPKFDEDDMILFPEQKNDDWREIEKTEPMIDEKTGLVFSYVTFERISKFRLIQ